MYKSFAVFTVLALFACSSSKNTTMQSTDTHEAAGTADWITLFDGKNLDAWHTYNKSATGKVWKIEEGALRLNSSAKKESPAEGGDLVTNEEYENFHLKLEWKIAPKGNSGIIFFIKEDKAYANTYETGAEMQVLDNGSPIAAGHPDGKLYTHRTGDLYDLMAAKETAKPTGEWNAAEIVANKGKLDFYLNGQHTLSTTMWDANWKAMLAISKFKDMPGFGKFNKGRIGLQDHGDDVWYRNIKIKRL